MITTEDYVSFETAKLLKEKGFDAECKKYYNLKMLTNLYYGCEYIRNRSLKDEDDCIAPSLGMAMKWLREMHKLYCDIRVGDGDFVIDIISLKDGEFGCEVVEPESCAYLTYEQASEAAIKYCLENLI